MHPRNAILAGCLVFLTNRPNPWKFSPKFGHYRLLAIKKITFYSVLFWAIFQNFRSQFVIIFLWHCNFVTNLMFFSMKLGKSRNCIQFTKPIIYLRQRQAEVQRSNLSSASIDGAMNRATCLRRCCDPSHRLLVDQSEASLRNSPPHAQYGWNMPHLIKTEKLVLYEEWHSEDAKPCPAS